MKAVIISKNGGPEVLELKDIKLNDPKSGEVLIKNEAIGLNYIDTYHRSGLYPTPLPSNIGIEGAGIIEKIGPDVKDFFVAEQEVAGDISTFIILDGSDSSSSNAGGKIQAEIANGVDKLVPENFATGLENHLVLELVEGDDHVGPFITLETGTDNFLLQEDGRKNPINNIIVQPVGDNHYHEPRGDPHVDGDGHTPEQHREIALWKYKLKVLVDQERTNASSL